MSDIQDFGELEPKEQRNPEVKKQEELKSIFGNIKLSPEDINLLLTHFEDINFLFKSEQKSNLLSNIKENLPLDDIKLVKIINNNKYKEIDDTTKKIDDTTKKIDDTTKKIDDTTKKIDDTTKKIDDTIELEKAKQEKVLEDGERIAEEINLKGLKGYDKLKSEAESKIKSKNPELEKPENEKELEKQTNAFILAFNQEEIYKENPGIKEKYGAQLNEFKQQAIDSKLFSGIELSGKYETISKAFENKPGVLKSEIIKAQELLVPDGKGLKIKGNEIISGGDGEDQVKQVITIDENGVQKSISKYGYKINVPTSISFNPESKREIRTLDEDITSKNKQIDSNIQLFSQLPRTPTFDKQSITHLLNNQNVPEKIRPNLNIFNDIIIELEKQKEQKTKYQSENKDTNYIDTLIELQEKQGEELQKEITKQFQEIYEQTNQLKDETQKLKTKQTELLEIDTQTRSQNIESQSTADNTAKDTLDFLNILGLTNINQNDLQQIITQININQNTFGLTKKININEGFTNEDGDVNILKRKFINLLKPIYEKMGIEINPDSLLAGKNNTEITNSTSFKQNLEKVGISNGILNINTFMDSLKPKESEKK